MEATSKTFYSKIAMESVWWLITILITAMVTRQYWYGFENKDFMNNLIVYCIIGITYARYLILLPYTFLAQFQIGKFVLIFASIPLAFYLIQELFEYHELLANDGTQVFQAYFKSSMTTNDIYSLLERLSPVYTFFAVLSIMSVIILPFRLLISFWRVYNNTGKV